MNKRIVALLAALLMVLTMFQASSEMTEEEKIADLTKNFNTFIEKTSYRFEYNPDKDQFYNTFELDSTLAQCDVFADLYDDLLYIYALPPLRVPPDNKDKVAIYLTLVNNNEFYSHYVFDYEDGDVYGCVSQTIVEVIPSASEIESLVHQVLNLLENYGNGLSKVALVGMDPHEAYAEALISLEAAITDKSL